ncbi:MAG: sulfite exporter TauE/SafE family protein [Candidatus Nanopusillus sp.]
MIYTFFDIMLILIIGIFAGIIGSITGLGGGTIISPILTIFLNYPLYLTIGISLLSTISTSLSSSLTYIKKKIANDNTAISLLTATTFGAIFGFLLNNYLYTHNLFFIVYIIFGVVLLLSSIFLIIKNLRKKYYPSKPDESTYFFNLFGKYEENGKIIYYDGVRWSYAWIVMLFAGFVSGLLGIGSGILKVLGMDLIMNLPIKVSTTTSNFMIGVTADTSSILYFKAGYIDFILLPFVTLGVLIGSRIGTRLLMKLKDNIIRFIFITFISYLGARLLLEGLNISNISYSIFIAFLVSLISFILLKKVKFKEKEEEEINFEKYIKEDDIFINKMYKFQKIAIIILFILNISAIIYYLLTENILLSYIYYFILISIPFIEVLMELGKYLDERNTLYIALSTIIIINLILGMFILPFLIL